MYHRHFFNQFASVGTSLLTQLILQMTKTKLSQNFQYGYHWSWHARKHVWHLMNFSLSRRNIEINAYVFCSGVQSPNTYFLKSVQSFWREEVTNKDTYWQRKIVIISYRCSAKRARKTRGNVISMTATVPTARPLWQRKIMAGVWGEVQLPRTGGTERIITYCRGLS